MVRRTCAEIIPLLAQVDNIKLSEVTKNILLEKWQTLLKDKVDSVKIRAVEATPKMLRFMVG